MNKFPFINFSDKKLLFIFLILLFGASAFFFYQGYRMNNQKYHNFYRYLPVNEGSLLDIQGEAQWEGPWENTRGEKIDLDSPGSAGPHFPFYYPNKDTDFKKYSRPSGEVRDGVRVSKGFFPFSSE